MDSRQARLIQQFARFPEPGAVKTRLQVAMTAAQACAVHEELLLRTAQGITALPAASCELWLDRSGTHPTLDAALALGMHGPILQTAGDLGERMSRALLSGLDRAHAVLLVGSDCPGLDAEYLGDAFAALEHSDVVLGPAEDGGFVLIGCRRFAPQALGNISWGQGTVLLAARAALEEAGLTCASLSTRYDIDTPEDLARWRAESSSGVGSNPVI